MGSFWGKEIAGALNGSISASRFRNQVASRVASEVVIYLASHVNSATISCLWDSQAMGVPASRNRYPLVNLSVDVSPAQSESV